VCYFVLESCRSPLSNLAPAMGSFLDHSARLLPHIDFPLDPAPTSQASNTRSSVLRHVARATYRDPSLPTPHKSPPHARALLCVPPKAANVLRGVWIRARFTPRLIPAFAQGENQTTDASILVFLLFIGTVVLDTRRATFRPPPRFPQMTLLVPITMPHLEIFLRNTSPHTLHAIRHEV